MSGPRCRGAAGGALATVPRSSPAAASSPPRGMLAPQLHRHCRPAGGGCVGAAAGWALATVPRRLGAPPRSCVGAAAPVGPPRSCVLEFCVFCSHLLPDCISLISFLVLIGCSFPLQTDWLVTRRDWIRTHESA